jgi:hypothetical protein
MFDPLLTFGALFHALTLIGLLLFATHRVWRLPRKDWPFVAGILFWATLVIAAHGASLIQGLGDLGVYIPATFLALGALLGLSHFIRNEPAAAPLLAPPHIAFAPVADPRANLVLKRFLVVSFGLAVLASFALGLSVYADNADSMIYRLPRAFWYVSHGSFLHPFDSLDKRITFYPLDGVALYIPLVLYNLPGTAHALPSLLAWLMVAYTTYCFARELGARRLIAFFAAWLVALTPSILAQATSTNDEILAAIAVLLSLFMGWRFLVTGQRLYFFLAAIAIGLSAGTKGHIVFLSPIILAALGMAVYALVKKPARAKLWFDAVGFRTLALSLLMCALMVVPFLFWNYASSGRFYFFDDFKHDVLNLGGSVHGALQNMLIYFSQMIFSPIADLNFWPNADIRQHFNNALNNAIDPLLTPFVDQNPAYYHMNYRFVGITLPVSVRFVEFSLWSAFVWLLWPFQAALALKERFPLRGLFFLLALTPFFWLLIWSVSTLYMEGTATYFTFYLICGAPASVFAFGKIRNGLRNEMRWIAVVFVALTSLLICNNLLMYSGFRALPDLVYARSWPYDWDLAEPNIIKEIRQAKRVRIIFTHEKMPYFAYMHWNPRAHFESPYPLKSLPEPEKVLQIFPVSSLYDYGYMPLKIEGKQTSGMTYLGSVRAIGKEIIFATGDKVDQRWPAQSNYIIPHIQVLADPSRTHFMAMIDREVPGLNADDHLEFSYEMKHIDETIFTRNFDENPVFNTVLPDDPHKSPYYLTIIVRSAWNHREITRATYRIAGPGGWLPDTDEY